MQFTAKTIAGLIDGKIEGDETVTVTSFGQIETATKGQLAFLGKAKYEEFLYSTQASILIINESLVLKEPVSSVLIRVSDPYSAFAIILAKYEDMMSEQMQGIQQPSYIASTAKLGENIFVGAFAYIGSEVSIGNNVKIFPQAFIGDNVKIDSGTIINSGVKIYHDTIIGKNVIIHAGTVIGSDGFGFAPQEDGTFKKIPQIGNVIIEDNVEIGANCTIDRSTFGATIIREGCKLDNLIQVAHNVEIGEHTVIAGQAGISGSTKIGKNAMIGGQAGVAGHLTLADGVKVGGQSGVWKTVEKENSTLMGTPAMDIVDAGRLIATLNKLPELRKKLTQLENLVEQLSAEKEKIIPQ